MTVPSLRNETLEEGRVVRAFRLEGSEVKIVENTAPDTEPKTDEFIVKEDGSARLIMGLRQSERFGTLLGFAPLEEGVAADPELVKVTAGMLLAAEGYDEAMIPPEARGLPAEQATAKFGKRQEFGMYRAYAQPNADLIARL